MRSVGNLVHQVRMFWDLVSKFKLRSHAILFNEIQLIFTYRHDEAKIPKPSLLTTHYSKLAFFKNPTHMIVIRAGVCSVPRLISGPDYSKLFHGGRNVASGGFVGDLVSLLTGHDQFITLNLNADLSLWWSVSMWPIRTHLQNCWHPSLKWTKMDICLK